MPSPREKLEEVLRGIRQRQEQAAQAESMWKRALPRCEQLARILCEAVHQQGLTIDVLAGDGQLVLTFPLERNEAGERIGARCVFRFNRYTRTMEGWRTPCYPVGKPQAEEHFFSLTVRVPDHIRHVNEFGPQGGPDVSVSMDTQEAFERAVVQFLEWALVGAGCAGEPVRLP